MAKTRAIVKRRKAIRNIRKITRTMELIATARFKKAMDRASEADAYTRKIAELAVNLSANTGDVKHPLLETHDEIKNNVLLVLCSNRGMCGGYNTAILREANGRIREIKAEDPTLHLELSGKRAVNYFRFQGIAADHTYNQFEDKPSYDEVEPLADRYIEQYTNGDLDRVDVCYMKFLSAGVQKPVVETLLPLSNELEEKQESAGPSVEYEFLPSAEDILEEILPVSFKIRLFKCFLDAAVSEQIARRVAMKTATENAGDMIRKLTLQYNRARQAQITNEIAEVIGGVEALG